jgi:DNA primase
VKTLKIGTIEIDFDVYDYLEKKLSSVKQVGDNTMAACPFHNERSPSFGVHNETGLYQCFGCGAKGNIAQLVKHLDNYDTVFDAEEFLVNMYGKYAANPDESFELHFDDEATTDYYIDDSILKQYRFRHPYLSRRNLDEPIQRYFEIGYSATKQAITIPYRDHLGRLLTVKFRRVTSKSFWYEPSMPSRVKSETLFAFDKVLQSHHNIIAITEAEIDCMSVWQARECSAFAIGGNQFTDAQAHKLLKYLTPEKELLLFVDNDDGGQHAENLVIKKLDARFNISTVDWSLINRSVKDANDLTVDEIKMLIENRKPVGLKLFF